MDINLTKKKQLDTKPFLEVVKYISIGFSVVTIVGLAIHPLIIIILQKKLKISYQAC